MEMPVLFVQQQRKLPQNQAVVCGPSYKNEFLKYSKGSQEVLVVDLVGSADPLKRVVDFSNSHMLSSSEQFGFDPVTTTLPRIRSSQNYSSAIIRTDVDDGSFVGSMIIPSSVNYRIDQFEIVVDDDFSSLLHGELISECSSAVPDEFFVCRFDGAMTGICAIKVSELFQKETFTEKVLITSESPSAEDGETRIFGLFGCKESAAKTRERSEILVGQMSTHVANLGHCE